MVRNYKRKTDRPYVRKADKVEVKKVKVQRIEPEHEEFVYMTKEEELEEQLEIEASWDDTMRLHHIKQHFLDALDKHFI